MISDIILVALWVAKPAAATTTTKGTKNEANQIVTKTKSGQNVIINNNIAGISSSINKYES